MTDAEHTGPSGATPRVEGGRSREQPTTTTVADRGAAERVEWATAGEVATGLDRARVALALASSWSRHAAAEGASY